MKKSFMLFLSCFIILFSQAQWSNTTNQFYDSLHMPVTTAKDFQQNEIVVRSYPDSGYFVIWEDSRTTGNQTDIYAQKYDKNGKALWANNGIPVAATTDAELLSLSNYSSSPDYRYAGHACTDSAGGFYIVYDANPGNFGNRIRAQHILPDGSPRFAAPGFAVATGADLVYYTNPQLVADGRKGCFISFIRDNRIGGVYDLFVYNYRDENGVMVNHGGGQADVYAENKYSYTLCGNNTKVDVIYPDANIIDYYIYPDLQSGCNIVFSYLVTSNNMTSRRIGFNQLCRVKKESHVAVHRRTSDIVESQLINYTYKKDSVVMLYTEKQFFYNSSCNIESGIVEYTNTKVENFGNGFLFVSDSLYSDAQFAKGTVVTTDAAANINVNFIAASVRSRGDNNWTKKMYIRPQEIYDSIPYQLSTDTTNPYFAYKLFPDKPLTAINYSEDTLLAPGYYNDEFALASSNNRIFAAGRISPPVYGSPLPYVVNLSQLQVDRITPDSLAVRWHTPEGGAVIGKELNASPGISYRRPFIATDERGNAVFSITDNDRLTYVSPIADSGRLVWGAIGKPIGSGYSGTSYYSTYSPYTVIDPSNGTAVIAWTDTRVVGSSSTAFNIFARHLDSLNYYDYQPPQRGAGLLYYTGTFADPLTFLGLTHTWNYFEGNNFLTGVTSTMSAVYDSYNLGTVAASALDHTDANGSAIRYYNNIPYLDRNYTISVEHNPNGTASIDVRLYFTTDQFKALQKAEPGITSPGDLLVIKQPKGNVDNPTEYIPVAGEELITPTSWSVVEGGYYIQIPVSSFSHFFIKKNESILPVKWVSMSAERANANTAIVSWTVANEVNIKSYLVQYSEDGVHYKDGFTVSASGLGTYSGSIAIGSGQYFVKIKETDLNGRIAYSNMVIIDLMKQGVSFVVSPNPTKSDVTLRYTIPEPAKASLRLIATNGATVWQQNITLSASGMFTLPVKGLPSGTYALQIITSTERQVLKIIKE